MGGKDSARIHPSDTALALTPEMMGKGRRTGGPIPMEWDEGGPQWRWRGESDRRRAGSDPRGCPVGGSGTVGLGSVIIDLSDLLVPGPGPVNQLG